MRWLLLKPKIAYSILLALLSAGLLFACYKLPFDPDLFWHIRAGKDIARIGVPFVDWYSHTFPTFFWINHEYAQDVFMGWIHGAFGFAGISIVYTLITTVTLSVGVWFSMNRRLPWTWSLVSGIAIALACRGFLGARPQMFTYALLLVLIGLIRRALKDTKRQTLWFSLIPLTFAVWANLHASFVAGFIVLLIVITTESTKTLFNKIWQLGPVASTKTIGRLVTAFIASVFATFLNPYGYNIWLEPYRTLSDNDLHHNIVEWFGAEAYTPSGWILFGLMIVFAALIVVRQKRMNLTDGALAIAFFGSATLAVRNIPLFLLIAIPLGFEMLRELRPKGAETAFRLWPTLVAVALFVAAGASMFPYHTFGRLNEDETVFADDRYPVGAAQYLVEHEEFSQSHPYNEYGWGGYLLYKVPWFKTFIDGRMPSWEQGGVRVIDKYFMIDRADNWEGVVDEYGIDLFVVRPSENLLEDLKGDDRFTEVFRDDQAVIVADKKYVTPNSE